MNSNDRPLTALEAFLVSRKNPNITFSEVRVLYTTDTFNLQGAGLVRANPDGLVESWLVPWAAREALSETSQYDRCRRRCRTGGSGPGATTPVIRVAGTTGLPGG